MGLAVVGESASTAGMNRFLRLLPLVALFAVVHAAPGDRTRVTIVSTTDLHTGRVNPGQVLMENAALAVATRVPGVDVIAMGHTHREVPSLHVNRRAARAGGPVGRLRDAG